MHFFSALTSDVDSSISGVLSANDQSSPAIFRKKNPMMWMEDRGAGEGKVDFDVVLNERFFFIEVVFISMKLQELTHNW